MFHVGYVPYSEHVQFGDFWRCLSIFRNATNLQKSRKQKNKRKLTYLAATHHPTHLAAQHCAGPCQPAASSPPGRQGGDAGVRELATTPPVCRFASRRAGRPPRHRPNPLDTSILPCLSPSPSPT